MHLIDIRSELDTANQKVDDLRCEMLRFRIAKRSGQASLFRNPLALLDSAVVRLSRGSLERERTRRARVARSEPGRGGQAPL